MDGKAAISAITEAADKIAHKWWEIRTHNADAAWDDFSFYKGNARFANGASSDLHQLESRAFPNADDACDAARDIVVNRSWDSDYDSPDASRNEMIEAIERIRRGASIRRGLWMPMDDVRAALAAIAIEAVASRSHPLESRDAEAAQSLLGAIEALTSASKVGDALREVLARFLAARDIIPSSQRNRPGTYLYLLLGLAESIVHSADPMPSLDA